MRTSKLLSFPFLFLIATNSPAQDGKVDFSGVWYLQKDRSEPSNISNLPEAARWVRSLDVWQMEAIWPIE